MTLPLHFYDTSQAPAASSVLLVVASQGPKAVPG